MALNAKKAKGGGGNFVEQGPLVGTFPARLVRVIALGLQPQRPYKGQEKDPAHEIDLTYELLDEFMVDENGKEQPDKPRWVSESMPFYNLSAEKARSTKRYNVLDPSGEHEGDWVELLGAPCMVTLVSNESNGKTYTNVGSISPMRPKDAEKANELVNDPVSFDIDEPDLDVFNSFPEWLQGKLKTNLEYNGSALQEALGEEATDPSDDEEDDDSDY